MKLKKRRTSKEICIFIGLFLIIFITIFHILLFSNTRTVSYYDNSAKAVTPAARRDVRSVHFAAESVARRTLSESLSPATAHDQDAAGTKKESDIKTPIHHVPLRHGAAPMSRARMRALAQAELKKMEKSLTALIRQNAPSPEVSINKYRNEKSALRLKQIIDQSEDRFVHDSDDNKTSRRLYSYNETGPVGKSLSTAISQSQQNDKKTATLKGASESGSKKQQPAQQQQDSDRFFFKSVRSFKGFDRFESYDLTRTILDSLETPDQPPGDDVIKPDNAFNLTRIAHVEERPGASRQLCPAVPSGLQGITRDVHLDIEVDIDTIIQTNTDVEPGGEWKPPGCISRHRLAIIIPYRDRWSHLKVLLYYLLPVLKRQQIHFRIFVVEQYGNQTFNKGRIMNAAYREALKLFDFQCVTFHDVDLVPEDDRNIYTCAEHPKHMSTAIDKFNYHLPYQGLVGGVLSFRVDHFQLVNGYSNMYWGWGGEDDDMTNRILSKGLRIFRPPNNVARYKMVKHNGRSASQIRLKLLRTAARRGRVEGLNNVPYQLLFTHEEKLFTHFMVDVGEP